MYFENIPIVERKFTFKIGIISKVYAVIPRCWQKIPTWPAAFLLSLPINLDVISQGHLEFFHEF